MRIRLIRSVSVVVEVDIGSAEGGDRLNGQPDPDIADHGGEDERDDGIKPVEASADPDHDAGHEHPGRSGSICEGVEEH